MATIIKRETQQVTSGHAPRAAAYNLTDISHDADKFLEDVRREAKKIVENANKEAAQIRQQAQQQGLQDAESNVGERLDKKLAERVATLVPALQSAVGKIDDAKQDWLRHWELSAIRLAAAMAARIVRREIQQTPEIAKDWIREALQLTAGASEVTVRLHPADVEALGDETEQLIASMRPLATATVTADNSLSPGDCRIETELGSVDQQVEKQLARMVEELG